VFMNCTLIKSSPILVLLVMLVLPGSAQYYSTGQDPGSIHWRQIKTDQFRLIYPSDYEKSSQYLSNVLEIVSRNETRTLSAKVSRIPVVIHAQSALSNGVTVWAPKRIELYPCPPQNSYPEEWLEQLVIHEYRHAVQISKLNRGFTKALYYIFGEQAAGAVLGLYVPTWFMEGDAVCTETALSNSGRGRTYSFENVLRAQLLEKGSYSYDKAVLGSYRTFIPDQYSLGYPLVAQARKTYGTSAWNTAIDHVAKYPFIVVPFSAGIKKATSLPKVKFYRKMLHELDSSWTNQLNSTVYTPLTYVTRRNKKDFSVYHHPVFRNDSTIISEKESMNDVDRMVSIDRKTGKEKKLPVVGPSGDASVSVSNDIVAWSEYVPDHRWQNRNYSVIRLYDLVRKKSRYLTRKTRYFAPFLSPDGSMIAAVRINDDNRTFIDILQTSSGKLIISYQFGPDEFVMTPNWSMDGKKLIFTILTREGASLGCLETGSGKVCYYLPFGFTQIAGPAFLHHSHILFTGDYSGVENLYAVDTLTKQVYQVISAKFNSTDGDFTSDRKHMIYSDYTSDGAMVAETFIDTTKWVPLNQVRDHSIKLYEPLVRQELCNVQDSVLGRKLYKMLGTDEYDFQKDTINGKKFTARKYSKWLNLFTIHSWAPAAFNVTNTTLHPGVSVLSQNVLSNTFASAGYDYDINEGTGKVFANFSYQGLYPVFDLQFSYGNRKSHYIQDNESVPFGWTEMNFSANVSIPWNFSRGRFYRTLQPSVGTSLINSIHTASTPEWFTKGLIQSMDYRVYASQYCSSVPKDMYPKWGQILDINYRNTPFKGNNMGYIVSGETNLYFPGLFNHHSFWFYGAVQEQEINPHSSYQFNSIINYPRGYTSQDNSRLFSLWFNYKLPLFYPDLSITSLVYFKRFKLNMFFDYGEGVSFGNLNIYQSTGAELTADLHILRFVAPFELGIRSIYFPLEGTFGWEFLYSVSY
jgi:hypothetical protein